jgi:hypothetical protein
MILSPSIIFKWFDDNNDPANGWKLYTYIAGTSDSIATYTDSTGASENTNPIVLNARGEARLWLDPSIAYKFIVTTPTGDPLSPEFEEDDITSGSGSVSGLSRVYYNNSNSIDFSGLGTNATPLSANVKLSSYANNALQIRADGLYAMAIGGGGSVAWGGITGNIEDQDDLIAKFGEYLLLTFASPQVLTFTGQSQFVFAGAGEFVAQSIAAGSSENDFVSLMPSSMSVRFVDGATSNDSRLVGSVAGSYTWTLPSASGTIALTSQIPTIPVTSVFGRTGAVTAQSGDYNTSQVPESGNLYFTDARVRSVALTGFSATNSAIVATDSVLIGFNKAQGQINNKQPLNANLTELSALSGTSGLIRRTGSTYVYDNAAYITASALADYIAKNGTTTTTASIPFALGISVSGTANFADGLRATSGYFGAGSPQIFIGATDNTYLFGASTANFDAVNLIAKASGTGVKDSSILVGGPKASTDTGYITLDTQLLTLNGTINKITWNGSATPPTGTQAYLLAIDASGNVIQGSAGSGVVTNSGHNDLSTPWSIGDASTWSGSSAGMEINPVGAYGLHLKGNILVEQAVSQALTLYRPVSSGDICLNYMAQDALGAQANYAQVCGVAVTPTSGAVVGGLDLKVAIAGVLTPILQLRQAGSTISSALSGSTISLTTGTALPLVLNTTGASVGCQIRFDNAHTTTGWRWGLSSDTLGDIILVNDDLSTIPFRYAKTDDSLTLGGALITSASTTTRAGLRVPHGTAPTTPTNGDVWSTTAGLFARINGATATIATLGSQTFTGTQTFNIITSTNTITGRQLAQTRQTSATTTGAITWTLTSGGTMDLTGTLTGGVTMNITAPSAGAWSVLFVTQGATPQTVTLSLTGVSWILTGANGLTGTNTIVIPTAAFIANKSSVIQLYWSTATRCYVTVT